MTPETENAGEQQTDNPAEEQNETATVPSDFCPGMDLKEGDTFTVKVVSVNSDDGSMDIVYSPSTKPKAGIKASASQFDSPMADDSAQPS